MSRCLHNCFCPWVRLTLRIHERVIGLTGFGGGRPTESVLARLLLLLGFLLWRWLLGLRDRGTATVSPNGGSLVAGGWWVRWAVA